MSSCEDGNEDEIELEYGLRQCLPVAKLTSLSATSFVDAQLDELTPEQYLGMVRFEAQKCAQIATSENTLLLHSKQQTDESDKDDDPVLEIEQKIDLEWVHQYLYEFQKTREDFEHALLSQCTLDFPSTLNPEKWLNFCLGNDQQEGNLPSVSLLQSMTDAQIELVIQVLVEHIQETEQMNQKNIFYWLFSLFVAIQFPIQPSTYCSIRCLLRICVGLLKEEEEEIVDELKIVVAVSGGFFGQSQLLCSLVEFKQT